jgi:hypothetical protein
MKNKLLPLLAGLLIVLFALGWFFLWSATTLQGQPPLTYLNGNDLKPFRDQFNRAASHTRMVLLLSPT